MYTPDAVHEFPFAPDGSVRRLDGRAAISSYMSHLPELIHFGALTNVRVREAADELIIEATGHHRRVSDNSPIDITYVWFITRHGEQVSHIRDYMNPLQLASL